MLLSYDIDSTLAVYQLREDYMMLIILVDLATKESSDEDN
jgi:hypothetical protein